MDAKDLNVVNDDQSDDEDVEIPDIDEASGKGQAIKPVTVKSSEEKGKVIVPIVKDIDDYIYKGVKEGDRKEKFERDFIRNACACCF